MLEAAVPSPNTLPVVEPIALLKAGRWPNDAVEPNAWGLPKAGGLPNTGALPKPPVEQQWLTVFMPLPTANCSVRSWVHIAQANLPLKLKWLESNQQGSLEENNKNMLTLEQQSQE